MVSVRSAENDQGDVIPTEVSFFEGRIEQMYRINVLFHGVENAVFQL